MQTSWRAPLTFSTAVGLLVLFVVLPGLVSQAWTQYQLYWQQAEIVALQGSVDALHEEMEVGTAEFRNDVLKQLRQLEEEMRLSRPRPFQPRDEDS